MEGIRRGGGNGGGNSNSDIFLCDVIIKVKVKSSQVALSY
jgi:hypothetical protein